MNANRKSNDKFNPWNYLIQGVPQESIHDPVLFLIHLIFYFFLRNRHVWNFSNNKISKP